MDISKLHTLLPDGRFVEVDAFESGRVKRPQRQPLEMTVMRRPIHPIEISPNDERIQLTTAIAVGLDYRALSTEPIDGMANHLDIMHIGDEETIFSAHTIDHDVEKAWVAKGKYFDEEVRTWYYSWVKKNLSFVTKDEQKPDTSSRSAPKPSKINITIEKRYHIAEQDSLCNIEVLPIPIDQSILPPTPVTSHISLKDQEDSIKRIKKSS